MYHKCIGSMSHVTKEELYLSIGATGFFMPVFQLADNTYTYALTQAANGLKTALATTASSAIPPTIPLFTSLAIVFIALAAVGILQDFEKGMKMKYKALIYNAGAILGLYVFWKPLSAITPTSLSNGAIFSSILSIVIMFVGIGLAIYLEHRSS